MIERMFDMGVGQQDLFGGGGVAFDAEFASLGRIDLGEGAWLDYAPMWLRGHQVVFDHLVGHAPWEQPVVRMYDRDVRTPRLVARFDAGIHEAILPMADVLSDRYGVRLDQVSAGWYRDGADSVAPPPTMKNVDTSSLLLPSRTRARSVASNPVPSPATSTVPPTRSNGSGC